jgi:hypothetical protein
VGSFPNRCQGSVHLGTLKLPSDHPSNNGLLASPFPSLLASTTSTNFNLHPLHQPGSLPLHFSLAQLPNFHPDTTIPTVTNPTKTDTTAVKKVIVDTWHPKGLDLTSHLSLQCGHISSFQMGAKIWIIAVLGTHVEDYVNQLSNALQGDKARLREFRGKLCDSIGRGSVFVNH